MERKTCKEMVRGELKSRAVEIEKLFRLYQAGSEESDPELGCFCDYGLAFDYVPAGTFTDQKRGYFRYQLSWGGPSEEFRFYTDECYVITRIEYWYLNWFDGAKVILSGKNAELLTEVFDDFRECGSVAGEFHKATANV